MTSRQLPPPEQFSAFLHAWVSARLPPGQSSLRCKPVHPASSARKNRRSGERVRTVSSHEILFVFKERRTDTPSYGRSNAPPLVLPVSRPRVRRRFGTHTSVTTSPLPRDSPGTLKKSSNRMVRSPSGPRTLILAPKTNKEAPYLRKGRLCRYCLRWLRHF